MTDQAPTPAATKPTKVKLVFKAVGSAPILKHEKISVAATQPFAVVDNFLRGQLQLNPTDALFLYVNQYCPSMDDTMSTLNESFGEGAGKKRKLNIMYALQPAWG
jgi:ubiquitin-like protein ATG12